MLSDKFCNVYVPHLVQVWVASKLKEMAKLWDSHQGHQQLPVELAPAYEMSCVLQRAETAK